MKEPVVSFVLSHAASSLEPLALHLPQFDNSLRVIAAQYALSSSIHDLATSRHSRWGRRLEKSLGLHKPADINR